MSWRGPFQRSLSLPKKLPCFHSIGIETDDPRNGIGRRLVDELLDRMRALGLWKIDTRVDLPDAEPVRIFGADRFSPSDTMNLERSI